MVCLCVSVYTTQLWSLALPLIININVYLLAKVLGLCTYVVFIKAELLYTNDTIIIMTADLQTTAIFLDE